MLCFMFKIDQDFVMLFGEEVSGRLQNGRHSSNQGSSQIAKIYLRVHMWKIYFYLHNRSLMMEVSTVVSIRVKVIHCILCEVNYYWTIPVFLYAGCFTSNNIYLTNFPLTLWVCKLMINHQLITYTLQAAIV